MGDCLANVIAFDVTVLIQLPRDQCDIGLLVKPPERERKQHFLTVSDFVADEAARCAEHIRLRLVFDHRRRFRTTTL